MTQVDSSRDHSGLSFRQAFDNFRNAVIDRTAGLALAANPVLEQLVDSFQGCSDGCEFLARFLGDFAPFSDLDLRHWAPS
jgi:hypothetical protein